MIMHRKQQQQQERTLTHIEQKSIENSRVHTFMKKYKNSK